MTAKEQLGSRSKEESPAVSPNSSLREGFLQATDTPSEVIVFVSKVTLSCFL